MKRFKYLILPVLLILSACTFEITSLDTTSSSEEESSFVTSNNETETSFISSYESTTSFISSDSSIESAYEKDEAGFYKLESDYFKNTAQVDDKETSLIRYSSYINEDYSYKDMRLYVGDKLIPLYKVMTNLSQTWTPSSYTRIESACATIELKGKATFKLQSNFMMHNDVKIRPLEESIKREIDLNRRVLTFEIEKPGQYVIEFRSHRTLHLFVNEYKEFENYKNDGNVIYFAPGVHNKNNSQYISGDNMIHLNSNQTIYLELGAILQCGFIAYGASNIKIVGSGIVDGSIYERNAETGARLIPYDFSSCSNLTFKGFTTLDPAGWCFNLYFSHDIELYRVNIITSRSNGDGISIQSCQNVTSSFCFVRSWDDSLVVKNYPLWSNYSTQGTTRNIVFKNCIVWTDLAQSMEVGYETYGKVMEDIYFEDIIILHNYHKAPISIHNGNNADIKRVRFKNITIEDASMGKGDGQNVLIDFTCAYSPTWSEGHGITELGSIDDVLVKNVKIIDGNRRPLVNVKGSIDTRNGFNNSLHMIKNVTFEDVLIKDYLLTSSYENYQTVYSESIVFNTTGSTINGANIEKVNNSMFGLNYQIEIVSQ